MPSINQGIIEQVSSFTGRLDDGEQDEILRLHNGQIQKGDYKGTLTGRLKHWFISTLTGKGKEERKAYLTQRTREESVDLARVLCKDISRRTPVIYKAEQTVNVTDVKKLLETSRAERIRFDEIVDAFVATSATGSFLQDPVDSATKQLGQRLMDRDITHYSQMHFLKTSVVAKLKHNHQSHLSRTAGDAIDQEMPNLALFQEAEQYAYREQAGIEEGVLQAPIPPETQQATLESFANNTPGATRKYVALMAAEHMIEQGVSIDPNEFPQRTTPTEETTFQNHLKVLRDSGDSWDSLIADLLENTEYEKAILVRDIVKDSRPLLALEALRERIADSAFDNDQSARRAGLKKRKIVKRNAPDLSRKRGQDDIDQMIPWRGGHTHLETLHAKSTISAPSSFDGNIQSKDKIINQTITMLKAKYPELKDAHTQNKIQEVHRYLTKHVTDRKVSSVQPFTYVRQPLKGNDRSLMQFDDIDFPPPDEPAFNAREVTGLVGSRRGSDSSASSFFDDNWPTPPPPLSTTSSDQPPPPPLPPPVTQELPATSPRRSPATTQPAVAVSSELKAQIETSRAALRKPKEPEKIEKPLSPLEAAFVDLNEKVQARYISIHGDGKSEYGDLSIWDPDADSDSDDDEDK